MQLNITEQFVKILNTSYNYSTNLLSVIVEVDWDIVHAACLEQGIEAIQDLYSKALFNYEISFDDFASGTPISSGKFSDVITEQTPRLAKLVISTPISKIKDAKIRIKLDTTKVAIKKKFLNDNSLYNDYFNWATAAVVSDKVIFGTQSILPKMVRWFFNEYVIGMVLTKTPNLYRWIIACFSFADSIYHYLFSLIPQGAPNIYYQSTKPVEDCLTFALNYYTSRLHNSKNGYSYEGISQLLAISTGITPRPYRLNNPNWFLLSRDSLQKYGMGNYPYGGGSWALLDEVSEDSNQTVTMDAKQYYIHGFSIPDFFLLSDTQKSIITTNIQLRLGGWLPYAGYQLKLSWAKYKTLQGSDLLYDLKTNSSFYIKEPIDKDKIIRYRIHFLNNFVYVGGSHYFYNSTGIRNIPLILIAVKEYAQEEFIYSWNSQTVETDISIIDLPGQITPTEGRLLVTLDDKEIITKQNKNIITKDIIQRK